MEPGTAVAADLALKAAIEVALAAGPYVVRPIRDWWKRRGPLRECRSLQASFEGDVIVIPNCPYQRYAELAISLDNLAQSSVLSTNLALPRQLFGTKDQVFGGNIHVKKKIIEHLGLVNGQGALAVRFQILHDGAKHSVVPPSSVKSLEQFEGDLKDSALRSAWERHYDVDNGRNHFYRQCIWETDIKPEDFLGDYVVYDNMVVLYYLIETHALFVMHGKKVCEAFTKPFAKIAKKQ